MKKALMIAHVASAIDQFNMPNIELLQQLGYAVTVACNFEQGNSCDDERIAQLKQRLSDMGVGTRHIDFARDVKCVAQNTRAFRQLKRLFAEDDYALVHCHTPIGGVLTRLAARRVRKRGLTVIYTAHGFHFFKGAPRINWLLYYPVEWLCAHWTDILITINEEDYALAQKHMHAKRVEYVPGVGIDLKRFSPDILPAAAKAEKRKELGLADGEKMLLSVGELIARKNHEAVIRALAQLHNPRIKYFICGQGELHDSLDQLAHQLGIGDAVKLLGYRTDIAALCGCADLFVFPSFQEGLPVALMEAIASGTLAIASDVRGNRDVIKTKELLFDARSETQLADVIRTALSLSPEERTRVIEENYAGLLPRRIEAVNDAMTALYRGA